MGRTEAQKEREEKRRSNASQRRGLYETASNYEPAIRMDSTYERNLRLADQLRDRAKKRQFKIPGTGMYLDGISSFSLSHQAKKLREGGTPVFGNLGGNLLKNRSVVVGVVHKGHFGSEVYSGRNEFNPFNRKNSGFDAASNSFGTAQKGIGAIMDYDREDDQGSSVSTNQGQATVDSSPEVSLGGGGGGGQSGSARTMGLLSGGGKNRRDFLGR